MRGDAAGPQINPTGRRISKLPSALLDVTWLSAVIIPLKLLLLHLPVLQKLDRKKGATSLVPLHLGYLGCDSAPLAEI